MVRNRELQSASRDPGAYGTGFVDGSGPGLPNVLILCLVEVQFRPLEECCSLCPRLLK
jgi:hypothetical protein